MGMARADQHHILDDRGMRIQQGSQLGMGG
jgi:hypothetical protein